MALCPRPPSRPQFPPSVSGGPSTLCVSELGAGGRGQQGGPSTGAGMAAALPVLFPLSPTGRPTAGGTLALLWTLLLSPGLPAPRTCLASCSPAERALCEPAAGSDPGPPWAVVCVLAGTSTEGPEIMENARISHLLLQGQSRSNAESRRLPAAGLPRPPQPAWSALLLTAAALTVTPALALSLS